VRGGGREACFCEAACGWFCRGSTSLRETRDVAPRLACRGAYMSQAGALHHRRSSQVGDRAGVRRCTWEREKKSDLRVKF
jgi:hypothetical protein